MKSLYIFLLFTFALVSCERLIMPKPTGKTPNEVFEHLWATIDEGYVYFKYREVDWDAVYKEFKPKIFDTMSERQLYDTCALMLSRLQDPYVSMKTSFAEYHFIDTTYYLQNFNRKLLERHYWKSHEQTGPFIHTVIDSIGYVYYGSFKDEVTDAHLDIIIERLRLRNDSIKGVVFDIRDNKGGDINNAFTLLKRMGVDTTYTLSTILFKAYYKKTAERNDFTEAQTSYIEQSDKTKFPKQFILLTNRGTMDEAALFAAGAIGYSNVQIFGDTTGGGAGRIVGAEMLNGWQLQFPASYFTTDKDRNIEDGVPPTLRVDTTPADDAKGKDAILEAALNAIKNP